MKIKLIILLSFLPLLSYTQTGITFEVERLSKPDKILEQKTPDEIYRDLNRLDNMSSRQGSGKQNNDIPFNIIAKSQTAESLVTFGYHSFFNGMFQAYADHRPFVLSPDMIWLLISQGFAQHVKNNSEQLRKYFVGFDEKATLTVRNDEIYLENPESPWETLFPEFTKQIAIYTGPELIDILTSDFTTSDITTKVASEITLMEAMSPYFEYVAVRMICGIPEITLLGSTDDWQKILDKAKFLKKYELEWWIDEIEPLLEEFIEASKGNIDKPFWMNMFKYHTSEKYGNPKIIDGWIIKFFPYKKDATRNNLKELSDQSKLPNEIVKVNLKYIVVDQKSVVLDEIPLELWAGFIGLKQDKKTFALTPEIGWMIRKKDIENPKPINSLPSERNKISLGDYKIRGDTIPK